MLGADARRPKPHHHRALPSRPAEIIVGCTAPLSGPAAAASLVPRAVAAYFDKLNADGGIAGRSIRFVIRDDGYQPERALAQVQQMVDNDSILACVCATGTASNLAIREWLNARGVPHLFPASPASILNSPSSFPCTIGWQPSGRVVAKALIGHLLARRCESRLAVLHQNDEFGRDYLAGARDVLTEAALVSIVCVESYEATATTIEPQLRALAASGAEALLNVSIPRLTADVFRLLPQLGWDPIHYVSDAGAGAVPTGSQRRIGASGPIITAGIFKDPNTAVGTHDRSVSDYLEWASRFLQEDDPFQDYAMLGYSIAQTFAWVIHKCGQDISREKILQEARNLNIELPLLLPGLRLTTTPYDHAPIKRVIIKAFNGTRFAPLAPCGERP